MKMKNKGLALLLCGLTLAFSVFTGCNFLMPGGSSDGDQPAATQVPFPAQTEPPAGGTLEDYVILINNTGGTVDAVYISANEAEYWGEPLDVPEIVNGASYKIRRFGETVTPYDAPIDIAFTVAGSGYLCSARGLEIKPGDRIRLTFTEIEGLDVPCFEVTHADGVIRTYQGSLKVSIDGTDRKVGAAGGF